MCEYNDDDDDIGRLMMLLLCFFPVLSRLFLVFFLDKFRFFVEKNTHQSEKHDKERIFFFFFKFLVIFVLFLEKRKSHLARKNRWCF